MRNNNYTYIRAVACIAIICLHTVFSATGIYGGTVSTDYSLLSYRVVTDNLMWAVPCFLMVTGALLLNRNKKITYEKLFKKYILRILLAIIVFVSAFSIIDTFFGSEPASLSVFLKQISEVWTGRTWSHMWYMYCLIGLYMLLPFYKKIVNGSCEKEIRYLMILYVIFLSVIPVIGNWGIETGFYINVSTIYPFYMFAGYYLAEYGDYGKKTGLLFTVLTTVAITLLSIISWITSRDTLAPLFGYNSAFVIMQSCAVFMLFMKLEIRSDSLLSKLLIKIDENGFGIYLVHMILVRYIFKQMQINPFYSGGWLCITAIILIVALLSWIIVFVLKKIPGFKNIL